MRLALAVDTTAEVGSVALANEDGVLAEALVPADSGFSQVLFQAIEKLVLDAGVTLKNVDVFAGASGPGSFTGVRVGLAAIKGLAEVLGKRVVAVSNLRALAEFGRTDKRVTVIDARRGEVFAAIYDSLGYERIAQTVGPLELFLGMLPNHDMEWISQGYPAPEGFLQVDAPVGLAGAIARIALQEEGEDPAAIEANYVRRSDAELFWKEA